MVSIVNKDNKILRKKAKLVSAEDFHSPALKKLIADMGKALLSQQDGVAIAAPQLGVSLRLFVVAGKIFALMDSKKNKKETASQKEKRPEYKDKVFINPEIVKFSKEKDFVEEGCLSVRYLYGRVERSKKIRIRAQDERGNWFELGGSGLLAQIFQHEVDHLNGILFIDKAKDVVELSKEEYEQSQK